MRGLLVAAVLSAWLLPCVPVRGGLYNTDERLLDRVFGAPADYTRFLDELQSVVAVETEGNPNSPRSQVLQRVLALEKKEQDGSLTYEERVNLSACYVRLRQPDKAIRLLTVLPPRQRDFVVLSNLAMASQEAGQLDRAESYLVDALEAWPNASLWLPNSSWRLNWLRLAEKYHLRLVRARLREQREGRIPESLDALFPELRWVGPSGEYEAGILAADQWAHLPASSMDIVKQLVLWMPHDLRLRWMLAEMVNVTNDWPGALKLMDDLSISQNYGNRQFREHHTVLRRAKDVYEHLHRLAPRYLEEKAAASLVPLGYLLPPGAGVTLEAAGTAVALDKIVKEKLPETEPSLGPSTNDSPATAPTPSAGWTPEWRQIGVSFVAGVIVAALLSLQLREMRKRKPDTQPASPE